MRAVVERSLLQVGLGALGGATMVVLAHGPWAPSGGWGLTLLLLLPQAAAVAALTVLGGRLNQSRFLGLLDRHRAWLGPVLLLVFALVSLLGAGFLLSNLLFLDPPTAGYTLVGYGGTLVVAAVGLVVGLRLARAGRLPALSLRAAVSRWMMLAAVAVAVVDATVYPEAYRALHDALTSLSLGLFVVASLVLTRNQSRWRLRGSAAVLAAGVGLLGWSSFVPSSGALVTVVERPSLHRRLLLRARSLLDQDGDGFSEHLGGGDCDDQDASAHPLSTRGRDCLGWMPGEAPVEQPERAGTVEPPAVILVVSIDAFRCGFGRLDRPELRDACPRLTARLSEARYNLRAHVFYPATIPSLGVMLGVYPRDTIQERGDLLAQLKQAGRQVEVIATHPHVAGQRAMLRSADQIDRSLIAQATQPTGVTSPAVTARILERLARRDGSPLLLWAHYYDPHAPYVLREGEQIRRDALQAYASEVRRTDEAIGALLDGVERGGQDVLVLITADHGEEFGERGARNHGHSLHQSTTQVPFMALRFGPRRGELPAEVPFSSHDIGRYVAAAAARRPFQASSVALGHLDDEGDRQFFVVQGPWKLVYHVTHNLRELYDLEHDPDEEHNQADQQGPRTDQLGRSGAALYEQVRRRPAGE